MLHLYHPRMLLGNCRSELLGSLKVSDGEHSFRILVSGFEPVGIERAMGSVQGTFTFGLRKYSGSSVAHKYTFTFKHRKKLAIEKDGGWLINNITREYEPDERLQWFGRGPPRPAP